MALKLRQRKIIRKYLKKVQQTSYEKKTFCLLPILIRFLRKNLKKLKFKQKLHSFLNN